MKSSCKRRSAFTLVELLVVIGIIALLISILLPSLNKARQFANSIKCASNQKSIYQAMAIYASQNHGFFPPASAILAGPGKGWANPGPNPSPIGNVDNNNKWAQTTPCLFWYDILSVMLNPNNTMGRKLGTTGAGTGEYVRYTNLNNAQNMAYDVNPMFHDVDVPDQTWRPRVSSYMVNMRVIAPVNCRDRNINGGNADAAGNCTFHRLRALGDIKRAGEVMMMWCGALYVGEGFNDVSKYDMSSWAVDSFGYSNGAAYIYPQPPNIYGTPAPTSIYERLIGIGTNNAGTSYGAPVTLTQLRSDNADNVVDGTGAGMRFRHLKNNSMNGLFVDGHVESRPLGSVIAKDVCLNGK